MKKLFIFFVFLLSLIVFIGPVFAIGQVTKPIVVDGALREEEFQETLYIVNNEKKAQAIQVSAEGEIAGWVKFYDPRDKNTEIEEIVIGAENFARVIALFRVPLDTQNDEYFGVLYATQKPQTENKDSEGSSTSVLQKIGRNVSITVSDEENIVLEASVIPKSFDVGKNKNIDIRLIYDNLSNVSLDPQIDFKIKDVDRKIVYNIIYPFPVTEEKIKPGEIREVPLLSVSTIGLKKGKYLAQMDFLNDNKIIATKEFNFSYGISRGYILGASITNMKFFWPILLIIVILSVVFVSILKKMRILIRGKVLKK
jgi:hypothetical protein